MKTFRIFFSAILLCLAFHSNVNAQQTVLDGAYIKEHAPTRKVIPYTPLREADVMWSKRIWRKVDLREKMNHVFYYPITPIKDRKSLYDVIIEAITNEGTITAYDNPTTDDEFKAPMTVTEVENKIVDIDSSQFEEDPVTGALVQKIKDNSIQTKDIKQYAIKEEWFFDRQKSVMEVRIIGIAPINEKKDVVTGEFKGWEKLFWIYFPQARYVFANAEVFNRYNDSERRTYADIFWKRMFSSVITKEANVYDRNIIEYKLGLDALLEAERIKDDLFIFEHDLWHF